MGADDWTAIVALVTISKSDLPPTTHVLILEFLMFSGLRNSYKCLFGDM